jgi:beta-phosphoglucomutase-like phosphatase (HAD superfamily)
MIKLILFDLDGVLIDAKMIHYSALNMALEPEYSISIEDHINIYDGKPTRTKLEIITKLKGLPRSEYAAIYEKKQQYTLELISKLKPIPTIVDLFKAVCCHIVVL